MTDTVLLLSATGGGSSSSSRRTSVVVPTVANIEDTTTTTKTKKKKDEDTNNNNNNNIPTTSFQKETQIDLDRIMKSDDENNNDIIKNDQSIVTNAPDSNQTMNGQQPIDIDDDDDDDHNDNDDNENSKAMMNDNVVVVDNEQQIEEIEEDDDDVIDDEQVNEFKEQLQSLGNYPDKVMINTLSMIATDYQDSFKSVQKLYSTWKLCLLQKHTLHKIHEMMPIIYVLDSILKNVPGKLFRTIVEKDYISWLPLIYHNLPTIQQQQKLYKVYVTWKEYNIFTSIEKWKEVGTSFLHTSTTGVGTSTTNSTSSTTNMVTTRETNSDMIIPRNQKDGTLILAKNLRQEMQNILDDIQQQQQQEHDGSNNDNGDELNKISLERLADINPTLLYNIKKAAEDGLKLAATSSISSSTLQQQPPTSMMMHRDSKHTVTTTSSSLLLNKRNNATNTNTTNNTTTSITPSFIIETRTMDTVQRSNEWYNVLLQQQPSTHTLSSIGGSSSTHHSTTTSSSSTTTTATDTLVNSITKSIEQMIHSGCCTETEQEHTNHDTKLYTQKDAVFMTKYYATGSAISQLLVLSLQQQQQQSVNHQTNAIGSAHLTTTTTTTSANHRTATNHSNDNTSSSASSSLIYTTNFFKVNKINIDDFTTEGIKPKKAITISLLYEIGLPYQSTIDGKRFRTEQQLSKHLDYIFQQKVLSSSSSSLLNTTTTSKERGWYIHDHIWTKEMEEIQDDPLSSMTSNPNLDATNQLLMDVTMTTTDPDQLYTVVADESRDTCVICGRRFIMYFDDSQEGQYKYRNCISIPMKGQHDNDDVEDEDDLDHDVGLDDDNDSDDGHNTNNGTNKVLQPQLIHGTCWIGLGQPDTISYDQTIYINKEQ